MGVTNMRAENKLVEMGGFEVSISLRESDGFMVIDIDSSLAHEEHVYDPSKYPGGIPKIVVFVNDEKSVCRPDGPGWEVS